MKKIIITLTIFAVVLIGVSWSINSVKANPSFFVTYSKTSSATTSPVFIPSGGTATSSLVMDSFISGSPRATSYATLLIQLAASTTPGTARLNVDIQYSDDGIDWYQDGGSQTENYSTTTKQFDISIVNRYTYAFSSTTASLGAGFSATSTRALAVRTPTRYVRAVFTSPAGATSLSYWAQWVGIKESVQ